MSTLVTILHAIVSLFLILTILLQSGKGGGMGGAFGGSNSGTVFGGSGGSTFLRNLTAGAATIFMATSIILAFLASHDSSDALEKFGKSQADLAKKKEEAKEKALIDGAGSNAGSAAAGSMMTPLTPDLPPATGSAAAAPATGSAAAPATGSAAAAPATGSAAAAGSAAPPNASSTPAGTASTPPPAHPTGTGTAAANSSVVVPTKPTDNPKGGLNLPNTPGTQQTNDKTVKPSGENKPPKTDTSTTPSTTPQSPTAPSTTP